MAKNKSKKGAKKTSKPAEPQVKTEKIEEVEAVKTEEVKAEKEEKVTTVIASEGKKCGNPFKGFFAAKHDKSENILTVFKTPRIWGAVIGEVIGTMMLSMFFLAVGLYQPLYLVFAMLAATAITYKLSGAHLNPAITVGMMASRRISAIRGVLYILAQVLGAWLGLLILNAFISAGGAATELPKMTEVASEDFWVVSMVEFFGAALLGYVFCRAQDYKKNPLAIAAIIGTGACMVYLFVVLISSSFLGLQNNFMINPAIALMYQILPTGGENFGELFGQTMLALCTYCIFPMVGAVIGFTFSDIAKKLVGECCCEDCCCKK
ncbi:MAG: aquaporin [Candidatus Saccharibacteria bacterium]|nr:aquaporin [Candidatus Saccharibacteria bacterium]